MDHGERLGPLSSGGLTGVAGGNLDRVRLRTSHTKHMHSKSLSEIEASFIRAYLKFYEAYVAYKAEQAENRKFMRGKRWTKQQQGLLTQRLPHSMNHN